jgi:preprotein translocase subunit SecA
VMNKQRKVIYAERERVLRGEDLREQIEHMIVDVVTEYVNGATAEGYSEDWDHQKLWSALKSLYPVSVKWESLVDRAEDEGLDMDHDYLLAALAKDATDAYAAREAEIDGRVGEQVVGEGAMRELERRVMLSVLDRKWREHLYEMDYLKEGIGLRAMAQRDPLIEYQREGFEMFHVMLDALKEESVGFLFNLQVEQAEPESRQAATPSAVPAVDPAARARQAELEQRQARAAAAQERARAERAAAGTATEKLPPALRGKGLDGPATQQLNYSGPTESGGVESRKENDDDSGTGSRRERRQAARDQAKKGRRGPRR